MNIISGIALFFLFWIVVMLHTRQAHRRSGSLINLPQKRYEWCYFGATVARFCVVVYLANMASME